MAPKSKPADKAKIANKQKVLLKGSCHSSCSRASQLTPCCGGVVVQAAEDKTFGLKNKNKSAKVQK
jgi:hypothetical protein